MGGDEVMVVQGRAGGDSTDRQAPPLPARAWGVRLLDRACGAGTGSRGPQHVRHPQRANAGSGLQAEQQNHLVGIHGPSGHSQPPAALQRWQQCEAWTDDELVGHTIIPHP